MEGRGIFISNIVTLRLILVYRIGSFVVLPGVNYAALVQGSG